MTETATLLENQAQGWHAKLSLGFHHRHRTILHHRQRSGPLSVQRAFYPEGDTCHVYLLHPPGGVVGGDRLDIHADLQANSKALITTPGATKFYRSNGALAEQHQVINLAAGARLEWLPQEAIYFPSAHVSSRLELNLAKDAQMAVWEIQCFGRPVIAEKFIQGGIRNRWMIKREGLPVFTESVHASEETLNQSALFCGFAVSGTFIISGADDLALLAARDFEIKQGTERLAVTRINDLLIMRYLGDSTENARKLFAALWQQLRPMLFAQPAMVPRIWNT